MAQELYCGELISLPGASLIQNFCKTWTHPCVSQLDENNRLIINIKHKETEGDIYQECLTLAQSLSQCDHPHHTTNH